MAEPQECNSQRTGNRSVRLTRHTETGPSRAALCHPDNMSPLARLRQDWHPLLALAWPLVLAELGWMGMGVIDTIMVGRLPASAVAIGAVSLGTSVFYT